MDSSSPTGINVPDWKCQPLRTAKDKDDRLSRWVTRIAQNRHHNVAAVALANKTARIAWAMMKNGTEYQPNLVTH